jgi:hypothetical protein
MNFVRQFGRLSLFMLMLAVSLAGCSSSDNKFQEAVGIPLADYLDITNLDTVSKITGDDIYLLVANKTDDCVIFPKDYGIQVFAYIDGIWTKVSTLGQYANPEKITLLPKKNNNPDAIVSLLPDYSTIKTSNPQKVRVVLAGYLCQNDVPAENPTGDYIELDVQH